MFTGLIEATGAVSRNGCELRIASDLDCEIGDSIAVNGCCLTVAEIGQGTRIFHTLEQTLRVTNLGVAEFANLERALRVGDRLGGHMVSGHIDCTSEILAVETRGDDHVLTVALPAEFAALIIDKGSIAIDGISLTVAELLDDCFRVHIIPHSWDVTNLGRSQVGARVNLEFDMVGKFVQRRAYSSERSE
jgi:riboflavin synthase